MKSKAQLFGLKSLNDESNPNSSQQAKCRKNSSQKNGLQERNFYQCFCARSYQSYSALYLHVKIKHEGIMTFNSLKQRSSEWSGSIKNVYYEFVEEEYLGKDNLPQVQRNLRSRSKKINHDEVDKAESNVLAEKCEKKKEIVKNMIHHTNDCIAKVLEIYTLVKENEDEKAEKRKELMKKLIEYIDGNYSYFFEKNETTSSYSNSNTCQLIPLLFNSFFEKTYHEHEEKQWVIFELLKLSNWLHLNSYSTYLIVENNETPVNNK